MGKYFGAVGYFLTEETTPGVYEETIVEKNYYGDTLSYYIRPSESTDSLHDNIRINNKISIISDSFAMHNLGYMKYLKWGNVAWKISNVEVVYPRLILTIGEIYNGPTAETTQASN